MRNSLILLVLSCMVRPCVCLADDLPSPEQLVHFQPSQVSIHWSSEGWSLRTGVSVLKNFGRRNTEAADAMRLIRDLGLTERGVIGSPSPVLEYWLARGEAPSGIVRGQRVLPIDLESVKVETDGGQWCVRDTNRVLFNFGYGKQDAEQTLAVIQKYRFSRLLLLGQGTPSMMVFLRDPHEIAQPRRHTMTSLTMQPAHIQTGSFKTNRNDKQDGAIQELSAIQSYATPSVPPLRDTAEGMATSAPGQAAIPGITDRIVRVSFDYRQANLRHDVDGWTLHVGSLVLARFGADEQTARRGLMALNHYRFNEICLVGAPNPVAHFFTVNGHLPRGEFFGVRSIPVLTEKLKIQQLDGQHSIVQGTETVLPLGARPEDARQMLDWLERHKVDRLCRVTTADGRGMMFFLQR